MNTDHSFSLLKFSQLVKLTTPLAQCNDFVYVLVSIMVKISMLGIYFQLVLVCEGIESSTSDLITGKPA